MPFLMILPLVVVGIVIATTRKAAEQKKRAEALRREEQVQSNQPAFEGQATYVPVKPSVQTYPVQKAAPAAKMPTVQIVNTKMQIQRSLFFFSVSIFL